MLPLTIERLQLWQLITALNEDITRDPGNDKEALYQKLLSFYWEAQRQGATHILIAPAQVTVIPQGGSNG